MSETGKAEPGKAPAPEGSGVDLPRLVRRCEVYNMLYGTDYTPETYDDARARVPLMIEWDRGWEASERSVKRPPNADLIAALQRLIAAELASSERFEAEEIDEIEAALEQSKAAVAKALGSTPPNATAMASAGAKAPTKN